MTAREESDSSELLRRLQRGDGEAFSELYDYYAPRTFGIANRIDQIRGVI